MPRLRPDSLPEAATQPEKPPEDRQQQQQQRTQERAPAIPGELQQLLDTSSNVFLQVESALSKLGEVDATAPASLAAHDF